MGPLHAHPMGMQGVNRSSILRGQVFPSAHRNSVECERDLI